MARRRKRGDPIEALLILIVVIILFGTFFLTKNLIASFVVLILFMGSFFAFALIKKAAYVERLKKAGIADIDKMDGIEFEKYLGHLFRSHGFKVQVTQASGDFGADLIIEKPGRRIAIQAKRYSSNVGLKAVQEVVAAVAYYKANEAWVITTNKFTDQAKELANSNNVKLFNRDDLVEMILKLKTGTPPSTQQAITQNSSQTKICNRCGSQMTLRRVSQGTFYACIKFPKCKNVIRA